MRTSVLLGTDTMGEANLIERHPDAPDNILLLDRKESFADYARAYGNGLAEHLENRGIIIVPFMPIRFDIEQFQSMTFPDEWKKIGTVNGIELPLYARQGGNIVQNPDHPLLMLGLGIKWTCYLQSQIASFNTQLRHGLSVLFPAYHSLWATNITWRLTHTVEEGMHFDSFNGGAPLNEIGKTLHRVKIFMNIDSEPRLWRTSLDIPGVLNARRDRLPRELPDDVNVLTDILNKCGMLDDLPSHRLAYPTMSAVICNSEVAAHEVVYGRRVIGGEFLCSGEDMLDPAKLTHRALRPWLERHDYKVAADVGAVARRYADVKYVAPRQARLAQQQPA